MLNKISSLFFSLGLYIGRYMDRLNYTTNSYLYGMRYNYAIINPVISLLSIRKAAAFFMLSGKLNKNILPVIHGKSKNKIKPSNISIKNFKTYINLDFFRSYALRLFGKYDINVLLNKPGLISWWVTYFSLMKNMLFGYTPKYLWKQNKSMFYDNYLLYLKKNGKENTNYTDKYASLSSNKSILFGISIFYQKVLESTLGSRKSSIFRDNRFVRKYNKFFAFLKISMFLRENVIFPSILFYLNPTNAELKDTIFFRVCSIALINTNNIASIPLYPIVINNSSDLSKIFFVHLLIHFHYIGKILSIINII